MITVKRVTKNLQNIKEVKKRREKQKETLNN